MTTITKRVSGDITEGTTGRVSGDITEGTTKRVAPGASESSTKRVNYFDAFTVQGIDAWGGTWGLTWCMKWGGLLITGPVRPALDATNRVAASALTENTTKRVTI